MEKITEIPFKWVVLKTKDNTFKIYATWNGGLQYRDRWKISSEINKVEQDDDFYYFFGLTGSCYKCYKNSYGVATIYGKGILNELLQMHRGNLSLLENVNDWAVEINTNENVG